MTMLEQRFMEIMPKALYKLAEQSKRIADALENQNRLLAQGEDRGDTAPSGPFRIGGSSEARGDSTCPVT